MDSRFLIRFTSLFSLVCALMPSAQAMDWEIKNLGTLPGAVHSAGVGVNDLGQVTGNMYYGFINDDRATQYVYISAPNGGPLQLIDTSEIEFSKFYSAAEINNSGQVVGTYRQGSSVDGGFTTKPNGNGMQNVGGFTRGLDINDSGVSVQQGTFGSVHVIAPDGSQILIDPDGSFQGDIRSINNAGQVTINGEIWSPQDGFRTVSINGLTTQLYDINNSGQVLGSLLNEGGSPQQQSPLFVIDPDNTVHTLNISIDSQSAGIGFSQYWNGGFKLNDNGQVIGVIRDGQGITNFSFLTSIGTDEVINLSMEEDIIAAGWSNLTVSDINNLGQITGTGTINGATRAFLLTPVPEPETYAMMLAGLTMLGFIRRRKTGVPLLT